MRSFAPDSVPPTLKPCLNPNWQEAWQVPGATPACGGLAEQRGLREGSGLSVMFVGDVCR